MLFVEGEPRWQGEQLKEKLKSLRREAAIIDPTLARRIHDINRWVKDVKPGSLVAKKFVSAFLLQFLQDAIIWLNLQALPAEEQQRILEKMTPTETYWYCQLFPRWLQTKDAKFYIWKKKLMAGEFHQQDAEIIRFIAGNIAHRDGDFLQRYVADLSMATDLIVSRHQQEPLCIQITRIGEDFIHEKYLHWKTTLLLWEIDRGLLLSYDPSNDNFIEQLVNLALYNSDNLQVGSYLKYP